jgi:hypothetical protein
MKSMHEDRRIGGKFYRVILQPISIENPETPEVAVFVGSDDVVVGDGGKVVSGSLRKIHSRKARGDESDDDVLRDEWLFAAAHARGDSGT